MEKQHIKTFVGKLDFEQETGSSPEFDFLVDLCGTKYRNGRKHIPNPERGLMIYSLLKNYNLSSYCEIGIGKGYSLMSALKAFNESKKRFKITTVDINSERIDIARNYVAELFNNLNGRINFVNEPSEKILPMHNTRYDLIFIDGCHEKKNVLFDGNWAILNTNKFVLFDDYNQTMWPGVFSACNELIENYKDGYWRFIISDRLIYKKQSKSLLQVFTEGHGMLLYSKAY